MTDIPEDVMETATELVAFLNATTEDRDRIARAIMAEREQCYSKFIERIDHARRHYSGDVLGKIKREVCGLASSICNGAKP